MASFTEYKNFDDKSRGKHERLEELCKLLENGIDYELPDGRYKALALTNLEQAWSWVCKAIKQDQTSREQAEKDKLNEPRTQ